MFTRVSCECGCWDRVVDCSHFQIILLVNPQSRGTFKKQNISLNNSTSLIPHQLALTKSFHKINLKKKVDNRPQIQELVQSAVLKSSAAVAWVLTPGISKQVKFYEDLSNYAK